MSKGIIVDIGTGDGKFVYELAKEYTDRFIIGIDPHQKSLEEVSSKIYKKPQKGGLSNALFVISDVEHLPEELDGVANQVFVNFPWGSLLKGIVLVEERTYAAIKRICQKGAVVDIVFSYEQETDKHEFERLGLPSIDVEYIERTMVPKLMELGFLVQQAKELEEKDIAEFPSSWAKQLRFRKGRIYFYLRLINN